MGGGHAHVKTQILGHVFGEGGTCTICVSDALVPARRLISVIKSRIGETSAHVLVFVAAFVGGGHNARGRGPW